MFLVSSVLFSQNRRIDSLLTLLKNSEVKCPEPCMGDTNKIKQLNSLARQLMHTNPDTSIILSNQALSMAEKLSWKKGIVNCYSNLGVYYRLKANYTKALEYYLKAVNTNTESDTLNSKKNKAKQQSDSDARLKEANKKAAADNQKMLAFDEEFVTLSEDEGKKGEASRLGNIGLMYAEQGDYTKALDFYKRSLKMAEALDDKKNIASILSNISIIYAKQADYEKSLSHYYKALKIKAEFQEKNAKIREQNAELKAQKLEVEKKELKLEAEKKAKEVEQANKFALLEQDNKINSLMLEQKQSEIEKQKLAANQKAKELENLSILEKVHELEIINQKSDLSKKTMLLKEKDKEAELKSKELSFVNREKELTKKELKQNSIYMNYLLLGFAVIGVFSFFLIINIRQKKKAFAILENQAKEISMQKTEIEKSSEIILLQNKELEQLSIVASNTENTVVICNPDTELIWANESFTNSLGYTLEEFKKERGKTIIEISSNPEIRKLLDECIEKKSGISYETRNLTKHNGQRWFQTTLSPVFDTEGKLKNIIFIDSDITELKTVENQLQEKNKEITDSITYAKRIQDAILPPISLMKEKFPNSFVLFKPKDIVAGDFYWMEEINNIIFIAAADCTGHGVPGAMVSVVCSNALNRAVKEFELYDTGKILDKVTDLVLETFEKSANEVKDGMDISILSLNKKTGQINWSGANNPLWYFENRELKEITADKQPIGKSDQRRPFKTHAIECQPSTTFYLFTDGFADQFGGPKGKKFKYKQLQETLSSILDTQPKNQQEHLDIAFENWKGELEQVDDVCVIGIRV